MACSAPGPGVGDCLLDGRVLRDPPRRLARREQRVVMAAAGEAGDRGARRCSSPSVNRLRVHRAEAQLGVVRQDGDLREVRRAGRWRLGPVPPPPSAPVIARRNDSE